MPDYGLGSWPARRARINPAGVALRQGDRTLDYVQLAARVDRIAAAFARAGVSHGDRVAYLGPNDIATFEVCFASTRLGAVFTPVNWRLAVPEIEYLLDDAAPALLVHDVACTELGDGPRVPTLAVGPELEALAHEPGAPPDVDVRLDDAAVILYTSGTTGRPKGAVLTHANLTFNTMNQLAHADVLSTDTALCMSPLYHATGLGQVGLPTLFKGGTVVVLAKFDPADVLAMIGRIGVTSFSAVPTMLGMMADHPDFAAADLSPLRYVVYGGSPVPERVAVAWLRRGVTLLQGYGMTEAGPGVYMAVADGAAERPTSVGVPHFFTDVRIDSDGSEPGAAGELLVRGPNVFGGYWQRPEATAAALDSGWYRTGDVVRVDDAGWAHVVDRLKDLIISGGENVYPAEVEAAIDRLPGVVASAVIGVPDERWGEVGAAFVVPEAVGWDEQSLRAALRAFLAPFKIPRYVHFVTDLPRTGTGKLRKELLRNQLEKP